MVWLLHALWQTCGWTLKLIALTVIVESCRMILVPPFWLRPFDRVLCTSRKQTLRIHTRLPLYIVHRAFVFIIVLALGIAVASIYFAHPINTTAAAYCSELHCFGQSLSTIHLAVAGQRLQQRILLRQIIPTSLPSLSLGWFSYPTSSNYLHMRQRTRRGRLHIRWGFHGDCRSWMTR